MILVSRYPKGDRIALNPDLIERAETMPETVLILTDGTRCVVSESVEEVIDLVVTYRARIIASANLYSSASGDTSPHGSLRLVRTERETPGSTRTDGGSRP